MCTRECVCEQRAHTRLIHRNSTREHMHVRTHHRHHYHHVHCAPEPQCACEQHTYTRRITPQHTRLRMHSNTSLLPPPSPPLPSLHDPPTHPAIHPHHPTERTGMDVCPPPARKRAHLVAPENWIWQPANVRALSSTLDPVVLIDGNATKAMPEQGRRVRWAKDIL